MVEIDEDDKVEAFAGVIDTPDETVTPPLPKRVALAELDTLTLGVLGHGYEGANGSEICDMMDVGGSPGTFYPSVEALDDVGFVKRRPAVGRPGRGKEVHVDNADATVDLLMRRARQFRVLADWLEVAAGNIADEHDVAPENIDL